MSSPPKTYRKFIDTFPSLGEAWESMRRAGNESGELDESSKLLVKIGIAAGAMREGAVHSAVRKARAGGVSDRDILQVVALAASTLGLPSTVAVWTWVDEVLKEEDSD